jgi:hypothetical protein
MVSCDMKHKLVGSASCDIVRDTYLCTRDILPPLKEDPALGGPKLLGTCMVLLDEC